MYEVLPTTPLLGNGQLDDRKSPGRALEISNLLGQVQKQLVVFIQSADHDVDGQRQGHAHNKSSLVDPHDPLELRGLLDLELPMQGGGSTTLLASLHQILGYSVNTFSPGFLDKLYAATNAPGISAELVLSVLNTNVHVFQVSPALTLIEKRTTKALASLFGLNGPRSGGISAQGGSASNMTSIVIARNTIYPLTKIHGNSHNGRQLVLFTSVHGHYSTEKAAQACGFGSAAVISVPVDPITGAINPLALDSLIIAASEAGKTPFYINATAGTTVLGSFDPFAKISAVARKHNCWLHIDASWAGPFIFSPTLRHKLAGAELADSIAINPHKMMGVPLTCSFLLAKDLRQFHRSNTLPAGYLFHSNEDGDAPNSGGEFHDPEVYKWTEPDDLADMTLQCGRRGDSLKLYLSWQYYGTNGYAEQIDSAYSVASYFAARLQALSDVLLVSQNPPPCLQVCFYYAPGRKTIFGDGNGQIASFDEKLPLGKRNSLVTERIAKRLVKRGFMIDFAPALEGQEELGKFFRVVVNVQTIRETVDRLIEQILELGRGVADEFREEVARERGANSAQVDGTAEVATSRHFNRRPRSDPL